MSFFTEGELREFWQNGKGTLPPFPLGTRFSNSAMDFIKAQRIEIRFITADSKNTKSSDSGENSKQIWDRPGEFPVILDGPLPLCIECGQPVHSKPEDLTQLDSHHFSLKTNPRIIFRGKIDNLQAKFLLVSSMARRLDLVELALQLDTLAAYSREILSAEYHWREVSPLSVLNLTEDQLHDISHWPEKNLGINHIVPSSNDHEILLWLNVLRTETREIEILAIQLLSQSHNPEIGLGKALNRLSSAIYVLELYFRKGKFDWKFSG